MTTISLSGNWKLRYEPLSTGPESAGAIPERTNGWFEVDLPCDVRVPLIREGVIPEPLEKLNCFESEWVEKKSWWFVKVFTAPEPLTEHTAVRLVLDYLDFGADIFLNGEHLGVHWSVHYPFVRDIRDLLRTGENTLMLRLTTGQDRVSEERLGEFAFAVSHEENNGRPDRGDRRRAYLRKPQYAFGWDWGPRVASCGMGEARIELHGAVEPGELKVTTVEIIGDPRQPTEAVLDIKGSLISDLPVSTREGSWSLYVLDPGGKEICRENGEGLLRSGYNPVSSRLTVALPQLWWPAGSGEQPLYTAVLESGKHSSQTRFGIRTVELDLQPINESPGHRNFAFCINGVQIFAKGANWIPADSMYHRVTEEKYNELIEEAIRANFNMLRIWGGGIYEQEQFYRRCDELGIMVWQDFMFGCAMYPDRDTEFLDLVEKEIRYQVERLHNHPSLVLWCGNNENAWAWDTDWYSGKAPYFGGEFIYNDMAPRFLENLCPGIPYWNSSPYGGPYPGSEVTGDHHYWRECMMNPEMEYRIRPEEYDKTENKFISEYGYVGPCSRETIEKYYAGEPVKVGDAIWNHHNNAFEKDTVMAGIRKHYADPENLSLDEYLLYAGMVQGLMYGYSLESFRYKKWCNGGLFWMYNDTWGETGWTIVDYYLNRKISYPFVARALSPVRLILRSEGTEVGVVLCNDSSLKITGNLEFGSVGFDGSSLNMNNLEISIGPNSRVDIHRFPLPGGSARDRLVFARLNMPEDSGRKNPTMPVLPAILREEDFRTLPATEPNLAVKELSRTDLEMKVVVSTDTFAHGVHFNLGPDFRLDDEYFDLLPGEIREVTIRPRKENHKSANWQVVKPASVR